MTGEQKIREIIQALEALDAGDEGAHEHLPVILGDVVDGNVVTVGDIRVAIRQTELSEELVSRLIALDQQAESTFEARGHIRVFLSSPGDVLAAYQAPL